MAPKLELSASGRKAAVCNNDRDIRWGFILVMDGKYCRYFHREIIVRSVFGCHVQRNENEGCTLGNSSFLLSFNFHLNIT